MKHVLKLCGGLAVAVGVVTPSFATAVLDTTAATTFITSDVQPAIVAVGGGLLVLAALAMGYKWVKATFFG